MTIHQIECFLEVAHTLNFTEAASHLYISQQGLSRQISSLERELEMRLFERTTREVRLTRSGEILLWKWQNIPSLIRESVDMAREDNKREKDRIHVAILKMNGVMDVVGRDPDGVQRPFSPDGVPAQGVQRREGPGRDQHAGPDHYLEQRVRLHQDQGQVQLGGAAQLSPVLRVFQKKSNGLHGSASAAPCFSSRRFWPCSGTRSPVSV